MCGRPRGFIFARARATRPRARRFLRPVGKSRQAALVPDRNLTVFRPRGGDPMIAGNGDLVSGERYRGCDFARAPAPPCGAY